ncbi:MAG: hypothetical protein AAF351_04800 [Pseudomonadota bacterium]
MSQISQHIAPDGLQRIVMENAALRLSLIPEVGGKIYELVDRRSGFNWLWHHPRLRPTPELANAPFIEELDCGGWDEIVFSVTPCEIAGEDGTRWSIPSHGKVVGQNWRVTTTDEHGDGSVSVAFRAQGNDPTFHFDRTVWLAADGAYLRLDYTLKNLGAYRIPGYWCAHPLFRVDENTRIHLQGQPRIRVDQFASASAEPVGEHNWPTLRCNGAGDIDLDSCFGAERRFASKVYVPTPTDGAVSLSRADGTQRLRMQFDPDAAPWVGLWINCRAWSGSGDEPYFNMGIEPATAGYDDVRAAITAGEVPFIDSGDELRWSIQLELSA